MKKIMFLVIVVIIELNNRKYLMKIYIYICELC